MNLGWSYDERATDLFRRIDRQGWDIEGRDPALMLATESQERLDTLAGTPTFTSLARGVRDELRRSLDAPRWFQTDAPAARPALDRLLLPRVRHRRGAPAVLGRPRRARRRPPEGGQRPRACPLTGIGLFYRHGYFRQALDGRGWQQERFPRLDPRAMALSPVKDVRVGVELAGRAGVRPGAGGAGRPHVALPARHRHRRQRRRAPPGDRPPLRRRTRAAHPPGDRARHRRPARAARSRQGARGLPPERGPRRLPRARAHPPGDARRRAQLRRGPHGRPTGAGVHHPHRRARRHRPLPPRADRAVLLELVPRLRAQPRRPDGPRPRAGHARGRAVQHGHAQPAPRRHRATACPSCTAT